MREILFRGKRTKNGEWVEGLLFHHCEKASSIYSDKLDRAVWVIPETVGQFTGKTHKSGVKIFEGDILEYWDTFAGAQRFVVAWDDSAAAWTMQCGEGKHARSIYLEPLLNGMKIIGNIHDNPELLEVSHA